MPWSSPDIATPYVVHKVLNIPFVADIMNAVILVAVLSCLNSGVYAASRMLFALTKNGDAPRALTKLSKMESLFVPSYSAHYLVIFPF